MKRKVELEEAIYSTANDFRDGIQSHPEPDWVVEWAGFTFPYEEPHENSPVRVVWRRVPKKKTK